MCLDYFQHHDSGQIIGEPSSHISRKIYNPNEGYAWDVVIHSSGGKESTESEGNVGPLRTSLQKVWQIRDRHPLYSINTHERGHIVLASYQNRR